MTKAQFLIGHLDRLAEKFNGNGDNGDNGNGNGKNGNGNGKNGNGKKMPPWLQKKNGNGNDNGNGNGDDDDDDDDDSDGGDKDYDDKGQFKRDGMSKLNDKNKKK